MSQAPICEPSCFPPRPLILKNKLHRYCRLLFCWFFVSSRQGTFYLVRFSWKHGFYHVQQSAEHMSPKWFVRFAEAPHCRIKRDIDRGRSFFFKLCFCVGEERRHIPAPLFPHCTVAQKTMGCNVWHMKQIFAMCCIFQFTFSMNICLVMFSKFCSDNQSMVTIQECFLIKSGL